MKLAKREIDAATCPGDKRDILLFDDDLRGFALRVTSKGSKIFLFQYRRGSRVRRLVLGRFGEITPTQARQLALKACGEVAGGRDPVGEHADAVAAEEVQLVTRKRQAAVEALTLELLVKKWEATALAGRSAAHRKEAPAAIRRALPSMLRLPAASITLEDAQKAVDALVATRPVMARRTRDYARAMMNWAVDRQLLPANPFASVVVEVREVSRDRVLSDAELGAIWQRTGELDYPFGPLFRLLILTLQRRQEVAGMRWSELDAELTTWTIPGSRAKNRKAHVVHLAEPARAILREIRQSRYGKRSLVFTTTGTTPVSGFTHAGDQVRRVMDEKSEKKTSRLQAQSGSWRLHDFRRTGVTVMARLRIPPHVADRILNHVQGTIRGVAAVYQRHEFLEEREFALNAWAMHVLACGKIEVDQHGPVPAMATRKVMRNSIPKE